MFSLRFVRFSFRRYETIAEWLPSYFQMKIADLNACTNPKKRSLFFAFNLQTSLACFFFFLGKKTLSYSIFRKWKVRKQATLARYGPWFWSKQTHTVTVKLVSDFQSQEMEWLSVFCLENQAQPKKLVSHPGFQIIWCISELSSYSEGNSVGSFQLFWACEKWIR